MKNQHTNGPWSLDDINRIRGNFHGVTERVAEIAQGTIIPQSQRDANAALIAAAPELLAACEAALDDDCKLSQETIELLQAVIAKALGANVTTPA